MTITDLDAAQAEIERLATWKDQLVEQGTYLLDEKTRLLAEIHHERVEHELQEQDLNDEIEQLRTGLQNALAALDLIFAAQQPLPDRWFAYRDELIQKAREALKK